jgi:hypothetical protein
MIGWPSGGVRRRAFTAGALVSAIEPAVKPDFGRDRRKRAGCIEKIRYSGWSAEGPVVGRLGLPVCTGHG